MYFDAFADRKQIRKPAIYSRGSAYRPSVLKIWSFSAVYDTMHYNNHLLLDKSSAYLLLRASLDLIAILSQYTENDVKQYLLTHTRSSVAKQNRCLAWIKAAKSS